MGALSSLPLILGSLLLLVLSFFVYPPSYSHQESLTHKSYSYHKKNVSKTNKWSQVTRKKTSNFIVHPGKLYDIEAVFTFKRKHTVQIPFTLENPKGNTFLTIKHNNTFIDSFTLTRKKEVVQQFKVSPGDSLSITISQNGTTYCDKTLFQLFEKQSSFTLKYWPLFCLWFFFALFFYSKKLTWIFLQSQFVFYGFYWAEAITFSLPSIERLLSYTYLSLSLPFIYLLLQNYKRTLLFLGSLGLYSCYALPAFYLLYFYNFNAPIDRESVLAIFQTNPSEAIEFTLDFISPLAFLAIAILMALIPFLLYKQQQIDSKPKLLYPSFLILLLLFSEILNHQSHFKLGLFLGNNYNKYHKELQRFAKAQENKQLYFSKLAATKKELGETYVLVIGESLNKHHMGIYGYHRNTTPKLSQYNDLILHQQAYSSHTHTMPTLKMALTEKNQQNHLTFNSAPSILNVLQKAGFETTWISNQVSYGKWDNLVSVLASSADANYRLNKNIGTTTKSSYDGILLPKFKQVLSQKTSKNRLIVLHLMGNHTSYHSRYPEPFQIFQDSLKATEFGQAHESSEYRINSYDNSILYNDYILATILKLLKQENKPAGLIYFSDHSDDAIGGKGHSFSSFTYAMTQIPLITWLNQPYQDLYPTVKENLVKNANKAFPNDFLYDYLIGLTQTQTLNYSPQNDLSKEEYHLKDKDHFTLHGKKPYTSPQNQYYQNHKALTSQPHTDIILHNINTLGLLSYALHYQIQNIHFSVLYQNQKFYLSNNENNNLLPLNLFLESPLISKIQNIVVEMQPSAQKHKNELKKQLAPLKQHSQLFLQTHSESKWKTVSIKTPFSI